MRILVLEASTTSAKAMLYDSTTKKFSVKNNPYQTSNLDVTQHHVTDIYESMCDLGRQVIDGTEIDTIVLSGTWHSILLCDQDMNPITPALLWSNTEASETAKPYRENKEFASWYYHKTGCIPNAIYPFFKLKMWQSKGYNLSHCKILGQGDYNTYRLTGNFVSTACITSGSGYLNIHSRNYDKDLIANLGISIANLPKIVDSEQTFSLSKNGANDLGVQSGIPVFPCNSDGGLNQVGAGAIEKGIMTLSIGTSGALRLSTGKPILPEVPSTWCYLSPRGWLSGAATNGCCNCIDWYKKNIGQNQFSYDELEEKGRADIDLPIFLPFIYGERCPGWNDKRLGEFKNFSGKHTLYDGYRAIQEGVLFNLYQSFLTLKKLNGEPKQIRLSGGILNSEIWTQMCADIFQQELFVSKNTHESLVGGLVLALEAFQQNKDHVIEELIAPVRKITPSLKDRKYYEYRYEQYLSAYECF